MNTLNQTVSLPASERHRAGQKNVPERSRSQRNAVPFWFKPLVFLLSLLPFVAMIWAVVGGAAGPNPIEYLETTTGEWSLRFLLLSLLMTPLTQLFKTVWPVRIRRMIGLFAFFYVVLHVTAYAWLDNSLDLSLILADLTERLFITAGFVAFVILIPLAVTSNRYMVRRLGKNWQHLHRLVYLAAVASVVHFVWLAKGDRIEPLVYLGILVILLSYRMRGLLKTDR